MNKSFSVFVANKIWIKQKSKNEKYKRCTNLYEKYKIPWENLPSKVEQRRENPRKSETNTRVGAKNVLKIPTLKSSMVRKIRKMGARDYKAKQIFYGLCLWMKKKEHGSLELGFGWREKKVFGSKSHYPFCYVLAIFFFKK